MKLRWILIISMATVMMLSMAFADDQSPTNQNMNITHNPDQNLSNVNIICSSSPWIDPVSADEYERNAIINYTIVGSFNGTLITEISNNKSTYRLKPIKNNKNGSICWNGEIDGKMINQANNPYNITLILVDSNGVEVARSIPNKIFIGRPVLILHGLFQVAGDMKNTKLFKDLSKSHYTQSVEYLPSGLQTRSKSAIGDIADYGSVLRSKINEIKRSTGAERVDIIGYSMGGLVGRWYNQELGGSASIGKLIMLGTPNHGAEEAVWSTLDDDDNPQLAIVQMQPHSSFIKRLNGYDQCYCPEIQLKTKNRYITIASKSCVTPGHEHLFGYEVPSFAGGDGVVPYWSVRLPNVYNQDAYVNHLSLPDNEYIVSKIDDMLNKNDNQYFITNRPLNPVSFSQAHLIRKII